ncbi:hypothetical protein IKG45_03075 [Candidatus Saccharibacteria bacterium]|nr:hypothetical protein [Candidatus Saccharibacteria bacterium]
MTEKTSSKEKKPVYKKWWFWVIVVVIILGIGSAGNKKENSEERREAQNQSRETKREYIKVDIDELENVLDNNAALANETYNGKYLEITGRLGTIDSDIKYISLLSTTDKWDIIGVHCTVKNQETKDVIKTLSKDQTIIVKGQITSVGEVMGYSLNIDEIIAK